MTAESTGKASVFEKLADDAIVYRALLRKQWIDEETEIVTSDAFFLRKSKNEQGLSVNIASVCSPEQLCCTISELLWSC